MGPPWCSSRLTVGSLELLKTGDSTSLNSVFLEPSPVCERECFVKYVINVHTKLRVYHLLAQSMMVC